MHWPMFGLNRIFVSYLNTIQNRNIIPEYHIQRTAQQRKAVSFLSEDPLALFLKFIACSYLRMLELKYRKSRYQLKFLLK